jgi:lipoate-protein ligase A
MTADPIRVVRLYGLPPVRSQSVYHAVAYEATPAGPDTILLITPNAPYVSIGYHQQADVELDLSACRQRGLPIVRREVGGGAVYLDGDQVFVNWVMRQRRLPAILSDRYALYVAPLLSTYRAFGIQAEYRPINDVHVAGRKIGGTGAARIGEAEVLVGSLMLDFDIETMAAVLRVASAKMRDKVAGALRDYMTTMRRELSAAPERDEVVAKYLEECARILQRPLVEAELTLAEQARTTALEQMMASVAWIFRKDGRARVGVRVHAGVHVHAADHKAPAGLVRVTTVVRDGSLDDVTIAGDFTLLPQDALAVLEARLVGVAAAEAAISEIINGWYADAGVDAPGLTPDDLVRAVVAALPAPPA